MQSSLPIAVLTTRSMKLSLPQTHYQINEIVTTDCCAHYQINEIATTDCCAHYQINEIVPTDCCSHYQ